MSDEEDVPPLEDMSGLIHQIETLRNRPSNSPHNKQGVTAKNEQHEEKLHAESKTKKSPETSVKPKTEKCHTFGGMKKGFLFSSSSKPKTKAEPESSSGKQTTSKAEDDIPLLKPKDPEAKHRQYEIEEVQQAMSASQNFLQNKEWVSEDLLSKVEENKTLLHGLSDPHFMQALSEFQHSPQQAMEKYGSNPEIQKFLKEFCALLGDHFLKMEPSNSGSDTVASGITASPEQAEIAVCSERPISGPKQSSVAVHGTVKAKQQPVDEDEQRVQQLLANPEIRAILLDSDVKGLIDMLRTDPDNAQRLLHQSDHSLQMKIKRLVDVGLLQIQR